MTDSFPFCQEHYMELYHFLNKCSLCKSRLESKSNRYCSEPDWLNKYWSELFPGEAVHRTRSDKICDECYFAFQKLRKQSANTSLDSDLKKFLLGNHSPDTCDDHGTAIDCALHCTMSYFASTMLNGSVIFLPELFAFFEQCFDLYINSRGCSSKTPKKSHRWLLSCLISKMSDHFSHHSYKNSKKYGTMLYRKGCNILDMLHLTAYKYRSLVQQSKETIENSEICELNLSERVRGDIMREMYHTSLHLNNKLYEMGSMLSEILKNCDDLSDISFSDIMNHIEPTVWNFFTILSLNKSQLLTFQRSFDFDWKTLLYVSDTALTTFDDSVLRRILITSIFMFMQNKSSHLLQSQLTELIDSHSRSSELVRIMNKFGVGVSRDMMSRDIVKAINNLSDEKIPSELNSNHDSFKVATVDNVDRNIKSGEIVFGKKQENMHATTIQSVTPGPELYKNTASDYCSFVRQKSDDSNSTGSMAFKHVKVYGDGRCLFRCIATLLNRQLLLCARNEGGMPVDPRLENFETSLADILRADTVQTLEANLHFLNILDDAIKKALCEKQTGQFYSSLEEQLTSVLSHDEYAGELEICGLVYSSCCPIFLYQLQNGIPQCYIMVW